MPIPSNDDRPYPQRAEKLPERVEQVNAAWLTGLLQNRYPGLLIESMEVLRLINTHTTKMRLALEVNQVGRDAGIPRQVCLKANWSGNFRNVDITALEARFYYFVRDSLNIPAPACYYADWDPEDGQGIVVMEDLELKGGEFGQSLQHIGVDGVARALEGLARLHGAWWASPKLDSQAWLPTSMRTASGYSLPISARSGSPRCPKRGPHFAMANGAGTTGWATPG